MIELVATGLALLCAAFCALVVLVVLAVLVWWLFSPTEDEIKSKEDREKDPRRGWIQGVGLTLMDLGDYGYLSRPSTEVMLEESWDIKTMDDLDARVEDLSTRTEQHAWNASRAILLLRSAVGMGWLDNDTSFERCASIGVELQAHYPNWEHMAEDLLRSRRQWRELPLDGRADTPDMEAVIDRMEDLEKSHWRTYKWTMPLE